VNAHAGPFDHLDITIMRDRDRVLDAVPDAESYPTSESIVAGGRWTITPQKTNSGFTAAENSEDTAKNPPVINPGNIAQISERDRFYC
jgi:hypothetical protein